MTIADMTPGLPREDGVPPDWRRSGIHGDGDAVPCGTHPPAPAHRLFCSGIFALCGGCRIDRLLILRRTQNHRADLRAITAAGDHEGASVSCTGQIVGRSIFSQVRDAGFGGRLAMEVCPVTSGL